MCLAVVDSPTKHTRKRIGYKWFVKVGHGKFKSRYFAHHSELMEIGRTYHSTNTTLGAWNILRTVYPSGFHILLTKKDARTWGKMHMRYSDGALCKVKFSSIQASGKDSCMNLTTVVARRMTILKCDTKK